jgi:hypothetical protein
MHNQILNSMLQEFDGCEGADPGSPESPAIWLFGIEPGRSISDREEPATYNPVLEGYTIDVQIKWPFNRNAFKLFAAINGEPVSQYREFAELNRPFVAGSKGYFKGNLYPYACNDLNEWPEDAAAATGIQSKAAYQQWCRTNRFPAIGRWIDKYRPRLFIGVGNTCKADFSSVMFGDEQELDLHQFTTNGSTKKIYYRAEGHKRLVVIPHLSRGLHENAALQHAGEYIAKFIQST